ncbi:hypothetical protein [Lysinibacillus xylanilyticus]|uniref:hypothetical protein n=1 Tax=Lysinibacillus xylanilyticus TaxID=582475 RepID=UPI00382E06B6
MNNISTKSLIEIINDLKLKAKDNGNNFLVLTAQELHDIIGNYSNGNTRFPMCCSAMFKSMKEGDEVIYTSPSKQTNKTKIKYYL